MKRAREIIAMLKVHTNLKVCNKHSNPTAFLLIFEQYISYESHKSFYLWVESPF